MPIAKSTMGETVQAGVGKSAQGDARVGLGGVFNVQCFDADGNLKPEWMQHLLHVGVLHESGAPVWASPEEVDGSETVLADLLKKVQEVNKLTGDAVEEAAGN